MEWLKYGNRIIEKIIIENYIEIFIIIPQEKEIYFSQKKRANFPISFP